MPQSLATKPPQSIVPLRLTTTQRNAIAHPVSQIIFNTTTGMFEGYDGAEWQGFATDPSAGFTPASVPFANDNGELTQDNANFSYDLVTHRFVLNAATISRPTTTSTQTLIGVGSSPVGMFINPTTLAGIQWGLVAQISAGTSANYKVALAGFAQTGTAVGGDTYAANFVIQHNSGDAAVIRSGLEINSNENNADVVANPSQFNLSTGLTFVSGGSFKPGSAIAISSTTAANQWQKGIYIGAPTGLSGGAGSGVATTGIELFNPVGVTGSIASKQLVNAGDNIVLQRATDSGPTGYFLRGVNAANNTNLFLLDVSGAATFVSVTASTFVSATQNFKIGATNVLTNNGSYTAVYDAGGSNVALQLGEGADPTNYYQNTNHIFRTIGGAGLAIIQAAGAVFPTLAAPATPASGWTVYTDSGDGNKLKAKASNGTVVTLGTP